MRVVTDRMPRLESAALGVWVDAGARNENIRNNGVAHMLEHMAFKGTKRRSARDIAEEIEAVGGHLNAYTSRENTAYFARILKEDVPLAVDILADILQHSVFDEEELERERHVIIQEIGQTEDTPDDIIFDPHLLTVATGIPEHNDYAKAFFEATALIRERLPHALVSGGLSNVSFGLPMRKLINDTFIRLSVEAGGDSGIIDPIQSRMDRVLALTLSDPRHTLARDMLEGRDDFCMSYIAAYKQGRLSAPKRGAGN